MQLAQHRVATGNSSHQPYQPIPLCFHHGGVAGVVELLIEESVILLQLERLFGRWALCWQGGAITLPRKSILKLPLLRLQVCQPLLKPCSLESDICRQLSLLVCNLLLTVFRVFCLGIQVEAFQCRIDCCNFPLYGI